MNIFGLARRCHMSYRFPRVKAEPYVYRRSWLGDLWDSLFAPTSMTDEQLAQIPVDNSAYRIETVQRSPAVKRNGGLRGGATRTRKRL